ncbi:MAG: nucleotidyltransferase domain-containing protein [Smithellaceae bacterium]|nr:nucleotidyltransferase domain-containing protein [Smithellaceae bacterium]
MKLKIDIPEEKIIEFCRHNSIRKLAFLGSVLRADFSPESDIDVLVEFELDAKVGLQFFKMEQELSEILGRKVDLSTTGFLSKYFREKIVAEAEVLYDAA